MNTDRSGVTRRTVVRTATAGAITVFAPSAVQIASAATDSGHVELEATSTVPTDTSIDVTIYEDTSGDGTADNQEPQSLSGGTETIEYQSLTAIENDGATIWLELSLSTSDDSTTPELDTATVTLPAEENTPTAEPTPIGSEEPQGFTDWFGNYLFFVTALIGGMGIMGALGAKSMAIGGMAAYLTFAYIALETGTPLLQNILYVTLVLVIVGTAFKLWRLEGDGGT
jgi:hypothetical protein